MAVTLHRLPDESSQGDQQRSALVSESLVLNLRALLGSASTDTEITVRSQLASEGYVYGAAHPVLGAAYRLRSRSIRRTNPITFDISLSYKTPEFDPNNPADTPPWMKRTTVNYSAVTSEEPIDEDYSGNAIQTAAKEPIQGVTRPISDLVIKLKKSFQTFNPAAFYLYADATNSDTFLGFSPGVLKANAPIATENEWNGFIYYDLEMDIYARKPYRVSAAQAWYKRVLHQGYKFKPDANAAPELDPGAVVPFLLRENGTKLPTDGSESAVYLTFQVFQSVAFSGMGWGL